MNKPYLSSTNALWMLLLLLAGPVVSVAAQQDDIAALRAAVPLPRQTLMQALSLSIGMGYTPATGYDFLWEQRQRPAEIARLRHEVDRPYGAGRGLLLRHLGELYRMQGDHAEAQQAFDQAVALYRRELAQNAHLAHRGRFVAEYALALQQAGQTEEAERLARQAVRLTPYAWQTWLALGQIRMGQAQTLAGGNSSSATDKMVAAQAAWKETGASFDRAVALAPRQPIAYELRASFRYAYEFAARPSSLWYVVAGLADFEHAVALRPHDPYAVGLLAWDRYTNYGLHHFHGQSYDNFDVWKVIPQTQRRSLLALRRRIMQIARLASIRRDRALCARAFTAVAWLEYEFHDVPPIQPQTHLHAALALQPDLQEAEQLLMHTYGIEKQWGDLAGFCIIRAMDHPTARYHLIAAYADYKAKQIDTMTKQAEAALALEPRNLAANLLLASLLLQHGGDNEDLERAKRLLDTADTLLAASGKAATAGKEECIVLHGFYFALAGQSDAARQSFMQALHDAPQNADARQGLALLSK